MLNDFEDEMYKLILNLFFKVFFIYRRSTIIKILQSLIIDYFYLTTSTTL